MAKCIGCLSSVGSSAGDLPAKRHASKMASAKNKPHPSPNMVFFDTKEKLKGKAGKEEKEEEERGRNNWEDEGRKCELQERASWNSEDEMFVSTAGLV